MNFKPLVVMRVGGGEVGGVLEVLVDVLACCDDFCPREHFPVPPSHD